MAAAKLVTRCPACRTAFRLVADQLRLRQGLVRCGQCDTAFDAREHLIELPAPEPASEAAVAAEAAASVAAPAPPQETAPEKPHRRSPRTPHEKSREKSHEEAIEGAHDTAHGRAPRIPRKRHHAEAHPETAAPDAPGPHAAEGPRRAAGSAA
ncbi:zinc-ribbon domain-containing protein [Cupriavidus basilensis]